MEIQELRNLVNELAELMKENQLAEIHLSQNDLKLKLIAEARGAGAVGPPASLEQTPPAQAAANQAGAPAQLPAPPQGESTVEVQEEEVAVTIDSPIVGTFYRAPSPESGPYVDVGNDFDDETVLCIVEAMKVMNEIKAEMKGKILEVLVENGQPVEFGQPLFRVQPAE